jgi:hypothetical protein
MGVHPGDDGLHQDALHVRVATLNVRQFFAACVLISIPSGAICNGPAQYVL